MDDFAILVARQDAATDEVVARLGAALNVANALGAWLGGLVIAVGYGYRAPPLVGAALSVLGIGILLWSAALQRTSDADDLAVHSSTSTS